jgi:rod shape-determining protein MreD
VIIFGYLLLGLELTVKRALALGSTGAESVAPSFIVPFLVFLALSGPLVPTLWVAFLLGIAMDICSPREGGAITVIGPYALGSMAGVYFVYTMRGFMRRHWLSVIVLSVIASILIELVVVALFAVRGLYTVTEFVAWRELIRRVLSSLYTAATATVMAGVLLPLSGLFGFQDPHQRRFVSRRM